ncbi:MAG: HNH endonuclease [Thermoproteota archaeon]
MDPQTQLELGETYSQQEIEEIFDTSFGYQISGINLRNPEEGKRYVILTSKEGGPYNDELSDQTEEFFYIGEGLPEKGDQKLTPSNKTLIDSIDTFLPIFFFVSKGTGKWEYQGLVDVKDYQYVNNGTRNIFRFRMEKLGISSPVDYIQTDQNLTEKLKEPPELTDEQAEYENSQRKVRSAVFSKKIKKIYNETCAFCGSERYSPEGNPEVEAAHIYPKEENGADDLRNGLALCKLHHWAFDCGWLALTDDLRIIVKKDTEVEEPKSFEPLEGNKIKVPDNSQFSPHVKFIRAHRELHGFDEV